MVNRKVELPYFNVGKNYGSNQSWMMDPWMHLGGCAALTTCDVFIYMSMYKGRKDLYSLKSPSQRELDRKAYSKFAMSVKLYLEPRRTGIKDLKTYTDGVELYLKDTDVEDIELKSIEGSEPYEKIRMAVEESINKGMPLAYLMLKHKDKAFEFFEWHWFIVNGYEDKEDGFYIKAATYGKAHWLNLEKLWDTGYDHKGGIVLFDFK
ncbi:MAG: hypothetical protein ACLULK_09915 [Anaerovoracaceae bacterium]